MVVEQLPRLGKRELIGLLLFTCNYVVSVLRGFLFFWVLGIGNVISLWHTLSLPYNYSEFLLRSKVAEIDMWMITVCYIGYKVFKTIFLG